MSSVNDLDGYAVAILAKKIQKEKLVIGGPGGPAIVAGAGAPSGTPATGKGTLHVDVTNGVLYINTTGSTWVTVGSQT